MSFFYYYIRYVLSNVFFFYFRWPRGYVGFHKLLCTHSDVLVLSHIGSKATMGEDMVEEIHHAVANRKFQLDHDRSSSSPYFTNW